MSNVYYNTFLNLANSNGESLDQVTKWWATLVNNGLRDAAMEVHRAIQDYYASCINLKSIVSQ